MRPSRICGGAGILLVLVLGCSTNSSVPDPSLSYEVVAQNTAQYKGRRVKWYGQFSTGEFKPMVGKGSLVDALFDLVDTTTGLRVTSRVFAVEAKSQKDTISFMADLHRKPCWVTGTVAGTRKVDFNLTVEKQTEVPLLRDVQFEQAQRSPVK